MSVLSENQQLWGQNEFVLLSFVQGKPLDWIQNVTNKNRFGAPAVPVSKDLSKLNKFGFVRRMLLF